jgi:hypothetical protein
MHLLIILEQLLEFEILLTTIRRGITHESISVGHVAIDCLVRVEISWIEIVVGMRGAVVGDGVMVVEARGAPVVPRTVPVL